MGGSGQSSSDRAGCLLSAYGQTSLTRLATCHPVIQALMHRAIACAPPGMDWSIVCGTRSKAEQEAAFNSGASKVHYPKSKHNSLPSMAVDVAPFVRGKISWVVADYPPLAQHIKTTWAALTEKERGGFTLSWGGDWKTFVDMPHWELR